MGDKVSKSKGQRRVRPRVMINSFFTLTLHVQRGSRREGLDMGTTGNSFRSSLFTAAPSV